MKITYTGRQVELAPAQIKKLQAQFTKIGKLLDGKHEHEAHVILSVERHLHQAEVTVNYYNHQLVGAGSNGDLFNAIHAASQKLEKQVIKHRAKFRDSKRESHKGEAQVEVETAAPAEAEAEATPRVHRINHSRRRKPMTLDEAILEMDGDRPYVVYRDAENDAVRVLIRRKDGAFDLVEG